MNVREIQAKSILRKHRTVDSWFVAQFGMNLYRGCTHNCAYCDGRAEGYYVDGEFGKDVAVKTNAIELLRREMDPARKRRSLKCGFIMLGGGVGDSYQPAEKECRMSRHALNVIHGYSLPVHVLTKSTLVERDIDIIEKINTQSKAVVSVSISSVDDEISAIFEPGVPPPSARLALLTAFKKRGIPCGVFLLPVIPFITDTPDLVEAAVRGAKAVGADFIIHGGMTLKPGRQREYFLRVLKEKYPQLMSEYTLIYKENKWGAATPEYYRSIARTFDAVATHYRIPKRIPARIFRDLLDENTLISVILDQLDHMLKIRGTRSPYGYAAYSITKLKQPISTIRNLKQIKGVGKTTEGLIKEIISTGTSSYYERMLSG